MSGVLTALGLDKETVKRLVKSQSDAVSVTRNTRVSHPTYKTTETKEPKYLLGPTQLRIRHRLHVHEKWIVARHVLGEHPSVTAMHLCVSEESVRKRLRQHSLFASQGKAGRPRTRPRP